MERVKERGGAEGRSSREMERVKETEEEEQRGGGRRERRGAEGRWGESGTCLDSKLSRQGVKCGGAV